MASYADSDSPHEDPPVPPREKGKKISTSLRGRKRKIVYRLVHGNYVGMPSTDELDGVEPVPAQPGSFAPPADPDRPRAYDSQTDVVDILDDGRIVVQPIGQLFHPGRVVSRALTSIIKANYTKAWVDWSEVKKDKESKMWTQFRATFAWKPEDDHAVKKVFDRRASHRFSEMMSAERAKTDPERPEWIGQPIWDQLRVKWADPDYKKKCERAATNRASERGGCVNMGGSISAYEHAIRMEASLGRPPTLPEMHVQLHMREETGDFPEERPRMIQEEFSAWQQQYRETQESSGTEVDPVEEGRLALEKWNEIAGPSRKGRLPGSGGMGRRSFPDSIVPNFGSRSSETTSTARSHATTPEDQAQIAVLTQQLSNYERRFQEMQEQQAEDRRLAAEERRINEERWKQLMDNMSHARPSMPSSSSSVHYPQPGMQPYGYGQPYPGAFQPSFNYEQPTFQPAFQPGMQPYGYGQPFLDLNSPPQPFQPQAHQQVHSQPRQQQFQTQPRQRQHVSPQQFQQPSQQVQNQPRQPQHVSQQHQNEVEDWLLADLDQNDNPNPTPYFD